MFPKVNFAIISRCSCKEAFLLLTRRFSLNLQTPFLQNGSYIISKKVFIAPVIAAVLPLVDDPTSHMETTACNRMLELIKVRSSQPVTQITVIYICKALSSHLYTTSLNTLFFIYTFFHYLLVSKHSYQFTYSLYSCKIKDKYV